MLVASLLQQVSNSHCRPVLQRVPHLAHINPTQQASVLANQHQAQQKLAKVLQQVAQLQHL